MNRVVAAIAVGSVAVALAAGCASTGKLTAAEIVAKNVAARGGAEAWGKVETMVWVGHIESAHAPMPSMQFTLEQKRPNKTRLQINTPGEKSMRVFDGARGWKLRWAHGQPDVQPYNPQELRFAQTAHGIGGPLIDAAARGSSVTLEGVDDLAGRKAYHLSVRLANGSNEEVWVDAESYLEIRYDRMAEGPAGASRRVSVNYADYRPVDGLQVPFVIETAGTTPDKMLIESVRLSTPLDDSTFENPAAPHWRNRAPPNMASRAPVPNALSTAPGASRQRRGPPPR
jgi:hypothetical protein